MKKSLILAYGVACYVVSIATILYAALYFGNVYAPRTIDTFGAAPLADALFVNALLVTVFALQHSGMARPGVKQVIARLLSPCLVRSTYILLSSLAVIVLMTFWQPIGSLVWLVQSPILRVAITAAYFAGWVLIAWATFLIDHFEMFGLRQTWSVYRGGTCAEPGFQTPGAYRHVRHPVHLGWLIVLWATPAMTVTHLLLATGMTAYIVIGTRLEERALVNRFPDYRQYVRKVPRFIPSLRRRLDSDPDSDPERGVGMMRA